LPTAPITPQRPPVLDRLASSVDSMRHDQFDTTALQALTQSIGVVGLVGDETIGLVARPAGTAARDRDRAHRPFEQLHLRRRGRVYGRSERYTLAVDHHHALRALAALRLADRVAPFFAGMKLASANVSSQLSHPRRSSLPRNARHTRSQ